MASGLEVSNELNIVVSLPSALVPFVPEPEFHKRSGCVRCRDNAH